MRLAQEIDRPTNRVLAPQGRLAKRLKSRSPNAMSVLLVDRRLQYGGGLTTKEVTARRGGVRCSRYVLSGHHVDCEEEPVTAELALGPFGGGFLGKELKVSPIMMWAIFGIGAASFCR